MYQQGRDGNPSPPPPHRKGRAPVSPTHVPQPRGFMYRGLETYPLRSISRNDHSLPSPSNIHDMDPDGTTTTVIGNLPPHMLDPTPIYVSPTESAAKRIFPEGTTRPLASLPLPVAITSPHRSSSASTSSASAPATFASSITAPVGPTPGRFHIDDGTPIHPEESESNEIQVLNRPSPPWQTVSRVSTLDVVWPIPNASRSVSREIITQPETRTHDMSYARERREEVEHWVRQPDRDELPRLYGIDAQDAERSSFGRSKRKRRIKMVVVRVLRCLDCMS